MGSLFGAAILFMSFLSVSGAFLIQSKETQEKILKKLNNL